MPTQVFSPSLAGYVRKAGLSYPPTDSPFTQSVIGRPSRSFDSSGSQYSITIAVLKFSISNIRPGANTFVYTLKFTAAKNDADNRELRIDNYAVPFWSGIGSGDYEETELTGDAAVVDITALTPGENSIVLSGIPDLVSGNVILRLGISGGSPTGFNDLSFASISLSVKYSYSSTPAGLNIDEDANNGISIPRAAVHRFGWFTGQAQTRFILQYKRESDVGWTDVDRVTSSQFWDAPSGTFTSGADNNWRWRVKTYDDEGNLSALSAEKTFTAVATLAAPTVSPSGTVSDALLHIVITGMATHNRERFSVYEDGVLIYDTVPIVQTSGIHDMIAENFRNGKTVLEDGHVYDLRPQIIASDGAIGQGSSTVTIAFSPPATPLISLTNGTGFIEIGYENPAGGEDVDSNSIYVSTDYNPDTGTGTWRLKASGLENSQTADDPSYQFYEAQSGQLYWFKVRAWAGPAAVDSEPANITLYLEGWLWLHSVENPAETLLRLQGWTLSGGGESGYVISWQPRKTIRSFLNSAAPLSDSQITSDGLQVGETTIQVSIMNVEATGLDAEGFTLALKALMKLPGQLCIRGVERPLGLFEFGEITNAGLPVRPNLIGGELVSSFDFKATQSP